MRIFPARYRLKNAAVHYYFPSKTDLGVAILGRAIGKVKTFAEKWKSLPEDKQLKKFLDTYFESQKKGIACLMGGLSSSHDELPEEMQVKMKELGDTILNWVTECLRNGKSKSIFHFKEKPEDKALLIVSNMLSSLLLARVMGKQVFKSIYNQVLAGV